MAEPREPESKMDGKWLGANAKHLERCRGRWLRRRNRTPEAQQLPGHRGELCQGCRYWMPIRGLLEDEFGVCSNWASPFDRTARGADDGCDKYVAARPEEHRDGAADPQPHHGRPA